MKQTIHNLIIVDESGSMEDIKKQTISGFNETIQDIQGLLREFPDQEQIVTVVSFNSLKMRTHLLEERAEFLQPLNEKMYNPNGGTPLYDTMGYSLNRLKQSLDKKPADKVIVTIFTDGMENASREYNAKQIKNLVEQLTEVGWVFTYIGADHDVTAVADSLSIKNVMKYSKDENSVKEAFHAMKMGRVKYSKSIELGEFGDEYFDKKDWKNIE